MERAERAAERAAKAAERAAEVAERAAEREARDRTRDADRESRDAEQRQGGSGGGADKEFASLSGGSESAVGESGSTESSSESGSSGASDKELASLSGGSESTASESGSTESGSESGSSGGSDKELASLSGESESTASESGSTESGSDSGSSSESNSNSGSGSGSDDDLDDNSGHGSGDDGSDDDEDNSGSSDDEDEQRDRQGVIVPVENDDAGNPYREGELVIMSDDAGLVARAQALGFGVIEARELVSIGSVVARLRRPEGVSSSQALEMLRTREPDSPSGYNYIYRAAGGGPDQPLDEQREDVPAKPKGGSRIGVIDGFAGNTIATWPVERLVDNPALKGHGETVTSILLRNLSSDYDIKPDHLMLLDVMRRQGDAAAADVTALVLAFDRLVTERVDLVNLSLAGPDHPALRRAIQLSLRTGMIIVAAVGNEGPAAPPAFPAAYDGVVGVAAVDGAGRPYLYSGRGSHVDIAALGVEPSPDGSGRDLVGTSFAAPRVSAMLVGEHASGSKASTEAMLAAFARDAGPPGRDPIYGLGILNRGPDVHLASSVESP